MIGLHARCEGDNAAEVRCDRCPRSLAVYTGQDTVLPMPLLLLLVATSTLAAVPRTQPATMSPEQVRSSANMNTIIPANLIFQLQQYVQSYLAGWLQLPSPASSTERVTGGGPGEWEVPRVPGSQHWQADLRPDRGVFSREEYLQYLQKKS